MDFILMHLNVNWEEKSSFTDLEMTFISIFVVRFDSLSYDFAVTSMSYTYIYLK